jgi:hypothetical protein
MMNSDNNQREAAQGWQWGLDTENSVQAILHAEDTLALMRMVDDVIAGKVVPCRAVVEAFAERARRLPTEFVYRLAKSCPEHLVLGSIFCSRLDARPDLLDEWVEFRAIAHDLANNPNTCQSTIDKLALSARPTDLAYYVLLRRVSLPVLETLMQKREESLLNYFASFRTSNQALLRKLAADPDPLIRLNVATNPSTEESITNEMALRDEDVEVLARTASRSTDELVLDRLAEKLSDLRADQLATAILENPYASDVAKTVAVMIGAY